MAKARELDAVLIELGENATTLETAERKAQEARDRRLELWKEAVTCTDRATHKRLAETSNVTESYVTQQLRKAGIRSR